MKYKNLTDQELVMPNVGVIKPETEFEFDGIIENPNIKIIKETQKVIEEKKGR